VPGLTWAWLPLGDGRRRSAVRSPSIAQDRMGRAREEGEKGEAK
jgi:hypothetical protein